MRHPLIIAVVMLALAPGAAAADQEQGSVSQAALIGLARVKRDAGDRHGAVDAFRRAEREGALDPAVRAEMFWVLADVAPSDARVLATRLLDERPGDRAMRDRAIGLASAAGDEHAAIALARTGQTAAPAVLWERRLGESYLRLRDAASAVEWLRRVAASTEATPGDRALLAVALEAAGDTEAALRAWTSVPPELPNTNEEWIRSRLRAQAASGDAAAAAAELDAWVAQHPDDEPMRLLTVDLLSRTGRRTRALELLASSPGRSRAILTLEAKLAYDTGDADRAVRAQRALSERPDATRADRVALGSLLVRSGRAGDALNVAREIARDAVGCDEDGIRLLVQIESDAGAAAFRSAVSDHPAACPGYAPWIRRAVAMLMARGEFSGALETLRPMATGGLASADDRETLGKLLLWTGSPEEAIAVLAPLVGGRPAHQGPAEALVDAYRAVGRAGDAWRIVAAGAGTWRLSAVRLLDLAGLAIERGAPARALELAAKAERQDPALEEHGRVVRARALLGASQPHRALALLEQVPHERLGDAGTLALLDATRAMRGRSAALRLSHTFVDAGRVSAEVLARAALWTAPDDPSGADRLRARLQGLEASRDRLLEIEMALDARRPEAAVVLTDAVDLSDLGDSYRARVAELRSSALAAAGRYADAIALVGRLREVRPDDVGLRLRQAEYEWQEAPGRGTGGPLLSIAAHSERADAQAALASAFLAIGEPGQAVRVIAGPPFEQPGVSRVLLARALAATGDVRRALDVVPQLEELDLDGALLRARLLASIDDTPGAEAAYAAAIARPEATPAVFLEWSRLGAAAGVRIDRLRSGLRRFPAATVLSVDLARALLDTGRGSDALDLAAEALARDGGHEDLWTVVVDATRAAPPAQHRRELLDRLPAALSKEPLTVLRLAQRLAGQSGDDAFVDLAVAWAEAAGASAPAHRVEARLAQARMLQDARRWPETLRVLDPLVRSRLPEALRLRAQTLAWSGRHQEALSAYDAYLNAAPKDVEAAREQARVAGWAQQYALANRLYARLEARNPLSRAVRVEARAKRLYYEARWRAAADAYRQWLEIEPDTEEALFDLAESLTASSELEDAQFVYSTLASRARPHPAAAMAERVLERVNRPSVAAFTSGGSSDGYGGQRLLARSSTGALVTVPLFGTADQYLRIMAGTVLVDDGRLRHRGQTARAELAASPMRRVQVTALVELTRAPLLTTAFDAAGDVVVRPGDRIRIGAGLFRSVLWENAATISGGVAPYGPRAMLGYVSPDTHLELRTSYARAGSNRRLTAGASFSRRVVRGRSEIRVLAGAERTAWRHADARYFSPQGFVRVDAGPEWRYALHVPRFRADRVEFLSATYLLGTDGNGVLYHQPRARATFHLGPAVLDVDGSWIRSAVYRSNDLRLTFRIGG